MRNWRFNRGFTIVELLIVIVVLGVLTSIITIAFRHIQSTARDDSRQTKATIIAESLERYYEKNGEYPSIPAVTTQSSEDLGAMLNITDTSIFLLPRANSESGNSITASPPSQTNLQYAASSVQEGSDTTCKNEVDGGCDEFTLSWKGELDNTTKTIKSRQSGREVVSTPAELASPSTPNVSTTNGSTSITATVTSATCEEGAIRYKIRTWTDSDTSPPAWSTITSGTTTTHVINNATPGVTYSFQAIAQCYIGNRDSDWSDESNIAEAVIVSASTPTVKLSFNSTTGTITATATIESNPCSPASSIQYNILHKVDTTTAGAYSANTWQASNTKDVSTAAGRLYTFRAQTRCGASGTASSYSPIQYIHTAPSGTSMSGPSTGTNSTWSWNAVTCASSAGWSPSYETRTTVNNGGSWSDWVAGASTSRTVSTASQGFRYRMQTRIRCISSTSQSTYSAIATGALFDRPVTDQVHVRTGTIRTYRPDASGSPAFVQGQGRVHSTGATANASSNFTCTSGLTRQIAVYVDYNSGSYSNILIKGFGDSPVSWANSTTISFTANKGGPNGNGDLDDGESMEMKFSTRCARYDGSTQLLTGNSNWIDRFGNLYLINGSGRYHTLCDQNIPENPYCQGNGTGYNTDASKTGTCTYSGGAHAYCWGSHYNANTAAWGW